jgi:peptidoglycan/LPS O-acetylase OafA/YrhL
VPQDGAGPRGYIPALDGLRTVAVLTVLLAHGSIRLLSPEHRFAGGGLGVQIFFVLSGFLITSLLLAERAELGNISLRRFYIRRGLRIWPLYYAVFALYAFVLPAIDSRYFSAVYVSSNELGYDQYHGSLWPFALFLQNYLVNIENVRLGLGVFWSLAVEEQFYLVWPLLLVALSRARWRPAIPLFLVLTISASLVARALTLAGNLPSPTNVEWMTHTGLTGLACGSLLAWIRGSRRGADVSNAHGVFGYLLAWIVLGMIAISKSVAAISGGYAIHLPQIEYYEPLLIGIAVAAIIDRLVSVPSAGAILRTRPIAYLGRISYGMYVLHPLVLGAVAYVLASSALRIPGWLELIVFATATVLVAGLSFRYFERPILRRKRKFERVRLATPTAPSRPTERAGMGNGGPRVRVGLDA